MTGDMVGSDAPPDRDEHDAVGRGWLELPDGSRDAALFVLAGPSLAVTDLQADGLPDWYDLRSTKGLDAVGDPVEGVQEVELEMDDGRRLHAGWAESFCGQVVEALMATLGGDGETEVTAAPVVPTAPVAPVAAVVAPAPVEVEGPAVSDPVATGSASPSAVGPGGTSASTGPDEPSGGQGAAALVLEDVTYMGGHPDQPRKRKRCSATLTRESIEVSGPHGLELQVEWDVVRTLEAQNADEARFRMNTRIHRDATALVLECDDGMTLLLEARDCPTIALRGAIAQLVDDLPVVVV